MNEQIPERLQEFRSQYAPQRQAGIIAYVQIALMLAGFTALLAIMLLSGKRDAPALAPGMAADKLREFAVYLEGKSQPAAAIDAYEKYLSSALLNAQDRAKVAYSVAKLAIDAGRYEDALAYLYQSEFLDPESSVKDDINKKVVMCLDKLGRTVDLRHELRKRTDIKRSADQAGSDETVLAEFAGEVLTDRDLEKEIEKLPAAARDSMSTPEKKEEMAKMLVAQKLLLDKARRLGLDKDPEIQDQLGKQLDAMIVQKLIEDLVRKDVKVTPEDVERFYKAEPAKFTDPATAEVQVADADSEEAAKAITEFKSDVVKVRQGGSVPGAPRELNAESIFKAEPDATAGPVQCGERWYVFKVKSKTPEKLRPFEEVKEAATRMFQMQKEQERVNALVEETLHERDVTLHLDRLQQKATAGQ